MNHSAPEAEAVVTEGGTICFVGSLAEAERRYAPGAERFDLNGRCMIPGFIDAHGHFAKVVKNTAWAELIPQNFFAPETRSIDEIVETLRAHMDTLPEDAYVIGYGYHETGIKERRHPDRSDLDRVSSVRPVMIANISYHIFVFNTPALRLLGVDGHTADSGTTKIRRFPGTDEPNGIIQGPLAQEFFFNLGLEGEERQLAAVAKAQQYYFENGLTTVCEGKSTVGDIEILDLAARRGVLKADVVSFVDYASIDGLLARFDYRVGEPKRGLKIAGVKIISDGTIASGAYMSRPFEGTDGDFGLQYISREALEENIRKALEKGWQFCVHAIGDAAVDKLLDAYEAARAGLPGDLTGPAGIINHATSIRKDQLPRVKRLGLSLSLFPSATAGMYELFCRTVGRERAAATNPVCAALETGILVTAHNDTPVFEANPMIILWAAVNRRSLATGAAYSQEERVDAAEALRLVTVNVAKQFRIDAYAGSIEAGKNADFAVLDRNPLRLRPELLGGVRVSATVKRGETVFDAGVRG
jgi:predicted amidohydrolase YtcJ